MDSSKMIVALYLQLLKENKFWIKKTAWWAVFWFVVGMAAMLLKPEEAPRFLEFVQNVFREILGDKPLQSDFSLVKLIFLNNLRASLIVLFGGIILGLVPFTSIALNFFIVGYLSAFSLSQRAGATLGVFLLGVVPHGIVEIPLFILVAAFGLRLGWFWRLAGVDSVWKKLVVCLKDNLRLLPLLVIGFFLAAMIEVFVSGRLIAGI